MISTTHTSQDSQLYKLLAFAIQLPRWVKILGLMAIDFLASAVTFWIAAALRYGNFEQHIDYVTIGLYASLPIVFLFVSHFYTHVLRVFQDENMRRVLSVLLACLIITQFLTVSDITPDVPRAAPVIHVFLLYIWLWNSRIVLQFILSRVLNATVYAKDKQNVLIYGVGHVAKDLIHVLRQTHQYRIVGVVDERQQLTGARILGVKVYAADNQLPQLIENLAVEHIFFALPKEYKHLQTQLIKQLSDIPVKISQIPSLNDITSGNIKLSDIKPVDVLDVLERDTVEPNHDLLKENIQNKVVMVTGAGGSIGSELCRQIIKQRPRMLVLFELSEFALYAIQHELVAMLTAQQTSDINIQAHLGSVTNQTLLEKICQQYQVETIYHAAAYKHVPIVEANEYEGVMNNFVGTYRTLQAAINSSVGTFVAISTDKAVRPTNVMGATKRMAELACQALAASQKQTIISMVRFGNVLGSSGSVVPLFNKQIAQGGPVTVTHPEVTRYFMTIPEAAQLVIQAGAMAKGGEVFVLDMGEPVKIVDLAKRMIRLSGLKVKGETEANSGQKDGIAIEYVGLRPGEKLYEELIIGGDNIDKTSHQLIMQAREHSLDRTELDLFLQQVCEQYEGQKDTKWLKQQFDQFVEGYKDRPSGNAAINT